MRNHANRESILRREILEQPAAVTRLLDAEGERVGKLLHRLAPKPRFVMIAARGTSDNAARYAQYAFALAARLPVALAAPSIVTLYKSSIDAKGALFIAISQSGRSPDIVESLISAKRSGARTLSIVNNTESPLAAAADEILPLHAGPERSIAATKTYTAQLTAVALLAAALGRDSKLIKELYNIPSAVERALDTESSAASAAKLLKSRDRAVILARGLELCTAHELSLKLKELALLHAEAYSSADFQHGPIALAAPAFQAILLSPPASPAARELRALSLNLQKRGASVIEIGGPKSNIQIPRVHRLLSPIVSIVPGQWLAYYAAIARGLNPDRPVGITKITETR